MIEEHLARKEFATTEQRVLGEVEKELTELSYNAEQHEKVRHRLAELGQYEEPRRRLEETDRLIGQENEFISRE